MRAARSLIVLALTITGPTYAWGAPVLERVVLVERHGVRAPTQPNSALDALSAKPWPVWGVAPGALTQHGAEGVSLMGRALRRVYAQKTLTPASGCPSADSVAIVADGADARTRDSARAFARGFAEGCAIRVRDTDPAGPLFDSLGETPLDPALAKEAVKTAAGGPIDTPESTKALAALQAIVAPDGCSAHAGVCLRGQSTVSAASDGVKLKGPLATGATLAENLLLEYAEGLPLDQVGWGGVHGVADIAAVTPAHERLAALTRRPAYIAARRSTALVQAIRNALQGRADAYGDGRARFTLFVGHDTNLSNLAGALGLEWTLADQPDQTAPVATLAFELWRDDAAAGSTTVKVSVFYETLDQLRTLSPAEVRHASVLTCSPTQPSPSPVCDTLLRPTRPNR